MLDRPVLPPRGAFPAASRYCHGNTRILRALKPRILHPEACLSSNECRRIDLVTVTRDRNPLGLRIANSRKRYSECARPETPNTRLVCAKASVGVATRHRARAGSRTAPESQRSPQRYESTTSSRLRNESRARPSARSRKPSRLARRRFDGDTHARRSASCAGRISNEIAFGTSDAAPRGTDAALRRTCGTRRRAPSASSITDESTAVLSALGRRGSDA